MRFLRRSLTGLFLLALTLGLLAFAGSLVRDAVSDRLNAEPRRFPARERVVAVNVVPIEPATIAPELTVFGELRAARTLAVRADTGGTVTEVSPNFIEGGRVRAGEVLLVLDAFDAENALARANADLSDAQAAGREAEAALVLARDELAVSEEQAALRVQALERQRDLQARGVGTAPELEAAELAASSANQTVLTRRQAIADAEARIASAQTTLARQTIAVAEAERALENTTVRAAFDGVLSGVSASVGARVTQNEQLAELIDPTALEAAFRVSTAQYATLLAEGALDPEQGAPLSVLLDVGGFTILTEGRITRESATVGEGQTGRLIFAGLEPAPGLRAGDFVTVRVTAPEIEGVSIVPATAVAADGTVLVVDAEGRLQLAAVDVLRRQGNDVIIRADGLEGAMVVAERTPLLSAGSTVRAIGPGGPEALQVSEELRGGPPAREGASGEEEMVTLDAERRSALIALVEANGRMPADVRERIVAQLNQEQVPRSMIARLEEGNDG